MNNTMEYKGYIAVVQYEGDDKTFSGVVRCTRDLISFEGETVEELQAAFEMAVDDYLQWCVETNEEPDRQFSGRFMTRVSTELHHKLVLQAASKGISLNQFVEESLGSTLD